MQSARPAARRAKPADDAAIVQPALEADGVGVHTSHVASSRVEAAPTSRLASCRHRRRRGRVDHSRGRSDSRGRGTRAQRRRAGARACRRRPGRESGVTVDAHLRTSNRAVFAAGDVCLPQQFTHAADASARAVIQERAVPRPQARADGVHSTLHLHRSRSGAGRRGGRRRHGRRSRSSWADVDRARTDEELVGGVRVYARGGQGRGRHRDRPQCRRPHRRDRRPGRPGALRCRRWPASSIRTRHAPRPYARRATSTTGPASRRRRARFFDRWLAWRR